MKHTPIIPSARVRSPALISVIVPMRNAAATIAEQLAALEAQDHPGPWQLVVADNGSHDACARIARAWAVSRPRICVIEAAGRRGPAHARNAGVHASRGDFLAFCDADDVVRPQWLRSLAAAAGDGDLVGGALDAGRINPPLVRAWHNRARTDRPPDAGFMPYAGTANFGIWRDVFAALSGFDERLVVGEDRDLCWRAQLAGHPFVYAPDAIVDYRQRASLRRLARQGFAHGRVDTAIYMRFRHDPRMRRDSATEVARAWGRLARDVPEAVRVPAQRGRLVRQTSVRAGRMVGDIEWHAVVALTRTARAAHDRHARRHEMM